jgi:glycosyltransferase involved in cell wall biosynthesis
MLGCHGVGPDDGCLGTDIGGRRLVSGLRVAMVIYGDIRHDSRVQREASSLAAVGHEVTIYCLAGSRDAMPALDSRVSIIAHGAAPGAIGPGSPSPFRGPGKAWKMVRLVRRVSWLIGYVRNLRTWGGAVAADSPRVDVWHVHDFTGLVAIAGRVSRSAALVYDVHDLFVETGTGRLLPYVVRRAIRRYERHLVHRADLVVTVNQPLADVVASRCSPRWAIVVHNCPPRWTLPDPRPDLIREALGIPAEQTVVLYHGLLGASRGIDQLLEAILLPGLESCHLALMGYGEWTGQLKVTAAEPRFEGRVHVIDPVLPGDLLPWVASADVGAMAMPRASLNLYLSTPNKLFECLAAGTPVVVSDFPAVRAIVAGDPLGSLGAICNPADPVDVARALREILAAGPAMGLEMRRRCNTAARERWNWESEVARLTAAYECLEVARRSRSR